jgi:hypothetical protein
MKLRILGMGAWLLMAGCDDDPAPADAATTDDLGTTLDVGADTGATPDAGADAGTDAGADVRLPMDVVTPVDSGAGSVVVNEVRASGDDWIELFNPGTAPVDLGGYGVADLDTDSGLPRVASAVRFPAGTTIAPGAYLFVLADVGDAGAGPQTACLDGGPTPCFHAPWGISASRGETVSLVDPQGRVVAQGVFPMNAVTSGRSWGRLPNGTGPFAANRPTPGAPNAAP